MDEALSNNDNGGPRRREDAGPFCNQTVLEGSMGVRVGLFAGSGWRRRFDDRGIAIAGVRRS
jgi:hypothetical protein